MTTMTTIDTLYFDWMCDLISTSTYNTADYTRLLLALHRSEFVYSLPLDDNRYADGVDLRYRFGYEANIPQTVIASESDARPCSVLEMMVALAHRCEEHIMADEDVGNRTGKWFWDMIKSLQLLGMDNKHFDKKYVDDRIRILLNRQYDRNGKGGLFTVHHHLEDMRKLEIWYQLTLYLQENEGGTL